MNPDDYNPKLKYLYLIASLPIDGLLFCSFPPVLSEHSSAQPSNICTIILSLIKNDAFLFRVNLVPVFNVANESNRDKSFNYVG